MSFVGSTGMLTVRFHMKNRRIVIPIIVAAATTSRPVEVAGVGETAQKVKQRHTPIIPKGVARFTLRLKPSNPKNHEGTSNKSVHSSHPTTIQLLRKPWTAL